MSKSISLTAVAVLIAAAIPAFAQDSYQVNYAANFKAGDSIINLTNAGSIDGTDPAGDICANVYVMAQDQQEISCCTCLLTPNHLRTLSALQDLISNTLTPGTPTGITVALLATAAPTAPGASCNAATVTLPDLVPGLRAWRTTPHAAPGGGFSITESAFLPATLSAGEFNKLTSYCSFIQKNGSGFGRCKSCMDGAAGAAKH